MKKKFLSILLSLCMAISLLPAPALAEETSSSSSAGGCGHSTMAAAKLLDSGADTGTTYVASIGEANYATLQAAVDAIADNAQATITLLSNATENITIPADKNVTLDLNGKTLTNRTSGTALDANEEDATITNEGTLTLKNGAVDSNGKFTAALLNEGTAHLNTGAVLTKSDDNGQDSQTEGGISWYVVQNHGTMDINGANVISIKTYSSVILNGWSKDSAGDTVPTDSNKKATLTINSGVIAGGKHTVKNSSKGELIVTGGTLNGLGYTIGNATVPASMDVLKCDDGSTKFTGGEFKGKLNVTKPGVLTVTGGNFTDPNVLSYLDTSVNTKVGIKLAANVEGNFTVPASATVTLDLNGKTLTGTASASQERTENSTTDLTKATIVNHGHLTVGDSSQKKAGTITNNAYLCDALFNAADGVAQLNGGTFTHKSTSGAGGWYAIHNYGHMEINNGVTATMASDCNASPVINGYSKHDPAPSSTPTSYAYMEINGGTFSNGSHTIKNGDQYAVLLISGGTFSNGYTGGNLVESRNFKWIVSGTDYEKSTGSPKTVKCFAAILGGSFNGTLASDTDNPTMTILGGKFSEDPSLNVDAGFKANAISGDTYKYSVAELPENKIESASGTVYTTTTNNPKQSDSDVSVSISNGKLAISGKLSLDDKMVEVDYDWTDGKWGTITVTYDTESKTWTADPQSITAGNVTYNVDISGLSFLPANVKVGTTNVEKVAQPSLPSPKTSAETKVANDAVTALSPEGSNNPIAVDGLAAGVAEKTINADGTVNTGSTPKATKKVIEEVTGKTGQTTIQTNDQDNPPVVAVIPQVKIEVKDATITIVDNKTTLTLDISAYSQVVVTNKKTPVDGIKTTGEGQNAVAVGYPTQVTIDTPVTVTIPITKAIYNDGKPLYVKHTHGTVTETVRAETEHTDDYYTATFTLQGLSEVKLMTDERTCTINYVDADTTTALYTKIVTPADVGNGTGYVMPTPTAPTGMHFVGWKLSLADYETPINTISDATFTALSGGNPPHTVTATAVYAANPVVPAGGGGAASGLTLSFESNGGSAVTAITKDSGTTIDLSAYKPTREGYTFAGWFSDKTLTTAVTSVKLTASTTVYAKWTENAKKTFTDVAKNAFYKDAVDWAVAKNVTTGKSDTLFDPDGVCTRAEAVTFLWRAAGKPEPTSTTNPFVDVSASAYYYKAVLWAVEKGITTGATATLFDPDAIVSRAQTVTLLWRYAGKPEQTASDPFTDVAKGAYYENAILWAVSKGITSGTTATTFSPDLGCNRAQMVTFLYRQFGK